MKRTESSKIIEKHLSPFIVSSHSDEDTLEYHLLISLPPSYNLMLKLLVKQNQTIVYLRTDYWRVIQYIDDLFEKLYLE